MTSSGPRVFLEYDQAALDAAYDQALHAPNLPLVLKRYASNSTATRARIGDPERIAYGPTPIETLDIFRTARTSAPVQIFIHGGAWRSSLARDYVFLAEPFVRAGAHVVIPDFAWVQDVPEGLIALADQVRRAITWVYRHAAEFGGDPNQLYISGHSSGGHLAGVALTTDWTKHDLPATLFQGGVCISGIYDLKPVGLSARRSYVKFDHVVEHALSPQRHLGNLRTPLVLACGTCESPEFQRQTFEFAETVRLAGKPVQTLVGENYNHFEILETLGNPLGLVGHAALRQMGLTSVQITRPRNA